MNLDTKTRVLVVDDSALARKIVTRALTRDPSLEVIGTAADAYEARDRILELRPNLVTLDIEMPRMDGLTFLKILMKHHPLPVVIVSSLTQAGSAKVYEALEAGAVEVLGKPTDSALIAEFEAQLVQKVKSAAAARIRPVHAPPPPLAYEPGHRPHADQRVILFGASTGGVEALKDVLARLPADLPPICIVQHIPAYISARFASRLNEICAPEVREAKDGDVLQPGLVLLAPGGYHMRLCRSSKKYYVELGQTPPVNYQRPSVDVLFSSAAECAGTKALGILLTGMGKDGAQGLLKLKEAGAATIAQDEASCVIYGMPRVAVELGAARQVLPLNRIAKAILRHLDEAKASDS